MISKLELENVFVYSQKVVFDLEADMRSGRLGFNVSNCGDFNVLKSAAIFGPNNSGKTCIVNAFLLLKQILSGNKDKNLPYQVEIPSMHNFFGDNFISFMAVEFVVEDNKFRFEFKFDNLKKEFISEEFCQISKDKHLNESKHMFFVINTEEQIYNCIDKEFEMFMKIANRSNLFIHSLNLENKKESHLYKAKKLLLELSDSLMVLSMNNLSLLKTIYSLKNHDEYENEIKEFIKKADLDLEDIKYQTEAQFKVEKRNKKTNVIESVQPVDPVMSENLRLTSVYKGKSVPSLFFDSVGTKKLMGLAGFIIEAIKKGKTLIIDELDSSLHFKITSAIVQMFNSEKNLNGQLIFTLHDVSLLDCKRLFRKEQIWFVNKDKECVNLYSLSNYTSQMGVRETSDIIEKYKKNVFGALPDPDFINVLLMNGNGGENIE